MITVVYQSQDQCIDDSDEDLIDDTPYARDRQQHDVACCGMRSILIDGRLLIDYTRKKLILEELLNSSETEDMRKIR